MTFWQTILVSLITALIGGGAIAALVSAVMQKKNEKETRVFERKEKQYKRLLKLALEAYFEGWVEPGKDKEFLKELNTDVFIYASDDVLNQAQEFQYCFDNNKEEFPKEKSDDHYKKLVVSMRKELMKLQGKKTKIKPGDIDIRKCGS